MKPVTHLFQELVRDVHSQRWNEDELAKLSSVELHALTKLLSCPSSGVKQSVIVRLLAHRQLRFKLSPFADNPLPLADTYRRDSLRAMCKRSRYLEVRQQTTACRRPAYLAQSMPVEWAEVSRRNARSRRRTTTSTQLPILIYDRRRKKNFHACFDQKKNVV